MGPGSRPSGANLIGLISTAFQNFGLPPSSSAGASMADAVLRLVIEKGPRGGETNDFPAGGGPVRIGRVVRGNTLAIKDPGVSQKHLVLEPLASGWALTDLGSSNGTLLNGFPVSPSRPLTLAAGDSIKIGEQTSMVVEIVGGAAGPVAEKGKRRTRASSKKDEVLEPVVEEKKKGRGKRAGTKAKPSRVSVKLEPIEEEDVEISKKGKGRNGITEKEVILEPIMEEKDEEKKDLRRGRGRGRGRGRRGGARAGSAKVSKEREEAFEAPGVVKNGILEDKSDGKEGEKVVGSAQEEGEVEMGGENYDDDHMEKMTLEEWFDQMEKYLPQAINDVSEEIITSLREKARRLNEFLDTSWNAAG